MIWLWLMACTSTHWCRTSGTALHTSYNVSWQADRCEPGEALIKSTINQVDTNLSIYNPSSQTAELHKTPGPHTISEEMNELINASLYVSQITNGAFDPTVEPLMLAWGFYSPNNEIRRPSDSDLNSALSSVGFKAIELGYNEGRPTINTNGRRLDLSAVIEGHAADRVSFALSTNGAPNHLVEIGNELHASGTGPHGSWTIGLASSHIVLKTSNVGIATSGSLTSATPKIIVPQTGELINSDVLMVTVIAANTRTADALTTAVRVMGAKKGLKLLNALPDVEGLIWTNSTTPPNTTEHASRFLLPEKNQ